MNSFTQVLDISSHSLKLASGLQKEDISKEDVTDLVAKMRASLQLIEDLEGLDLNYIEQRKEEIIIEIEASQ